MRAVCGMTTVPARRHDLLPAALGSVRRAGFPSPHLFVDGGGGGEYASLGCEITRRSVGVRCTANWALGLAEVWARDSGGDLYVMFQDDIALCLGVAELLLRTVDPAAKRYWNLWTHSENQARAPRDRDGRSLPGWFRSNQLGRGALALAFPRAAVQDLLCSRRLVERALDGAKGRTNLDGMVREALVADLGYQEMCHNPSLCSHRGNGRTTLGAAHPQQPPERSFQGENWDARGLL